MHTESLRKVRNIRNIVARYRRCLHQVSDWVKLCESCHESGAIRQVRINSEIRRFPTLFSYLCSCVSVLWTMEMHLMRSHYLLKMNVRSKTLPRWSKVSWVSFSKLISYLTQPCRFRTKQISEQAGMNVLLLFNSLTLLRWPTSMSARNWTRRRDSMRPYQKCSLELLKRK